MKTDSTLETDDTPTAHAIADLVEASIVDIIRAGRQLALLTANGHRGLSAEAMLRVDEELSTLAAHVSILNSVNYINRETSIRIVRERFSSFLSSVMKKFN